MARTWLQIRVDLRSGGGREGFEAGRIFIVGRAHTFQEFAESINLAFARWDLTHLHEFRLVDGRRIGYPDDEFDDLRWEDHAALKVAQEVRSGDRFEYEFDFGDSWEHLCTVLPSKVDPREEYCGDGPLPRRPVPIWGWGTIPDQYGRTSFEAGDDGN